MVRPSTSNVRSSAASLPGSAPSGTPVQSGAQLVPPSALTRYSYRTIAAPPLSAGASQLSVTRPLPGDALTPPGASGAETVVLSTARFMKSAAPFRAMSRMGFVPTV